MTWYDELRQRLAKERDRVGVYDLADQTGVSRVMMYAILNGSRDVGKDTLEQIRVKRPDLVAGIFAPDNGETEEASCSSRS